LGQSQNLWSKSERAVVYDLKSAIEGVLNRLRGQPQWRKLELNQVPSFVHPGQVAALFYEGRVIGFVGALHPAFREEHKIRHDVAVVEIDLEALMRGQPRLPKLAKLSKYPSVERDLSVVLPLDIAVGDVVSEIKKAGAPLVQSVQVFDVFRGQGIPEGPSLGVFSYDVSRPRRHTSG